MIVIVVGATGFIGSHLVDALLKQGHRVISLSRNPPGLLSRSALDHKDFTFHSVDITDRSSLFALIKYADCLIHLASGSLPHSSNLNPYQDVSVNLLGALNLLDAAKNSNIKRFIFVSSGGTVYGVPKYSPLNEEHPTNPICSYGVNKLAVEKYISVYKSLFELDGLVLRVANPYGERQRLVATQGVIPIFLRKAMSDEPVEIWGDGTTIRDFIYISDLISAILLSCTYSGKHRLFNVGSGTGLSLLDLTSKLEHLLDKSININFLEPRGCDVSTNVLSTDLALKNLNWQPKVSIDEGLSRFYRSLV
tara:strand:+ start:83 stop:1003 length:921 start_codon:yes stop_codon:yes gene_type:complete